METGSHCPSPGTCDLVLFFFYFKTRKQERTISITLIFTVDGSSGRLEKRRMETGSHCPSPGTCDVVLCFFYFKVRKQERTISITLIFTEERNFDVTKKRWRGLSSLPTLQTNTPCSVFRPISRVPFRWTFEVGGCFTHSMSVFTRFYKWFYVVFLQTFWDMRHLPTQL